MILVGDIGGTNSRLAWYEPEHELKYVTRFASTAYASLEEIVQAFRKKHPSLPRFQVACFAVAGPVLDQRCQTTNLPWVIVAEELAQTLAIPQVYLINDLEATAYALEGLEADQVMAVQAGEGRSGNRAVVAPGTGLGEAGLYWDGNRYHPFACEGGHSSFAPQTEQEWQLCCYLFAHFAHVSYERILSGPGLEWIYRFLCEQQGIITLDEEKGLAKAITQQALEGSSELCMQTVQLFFSILGAECGDLALKLMAWGGVYLGGGILPLLKPFFQNSWFLERFCDKGRMRGLVARLPVRLILDEAANLKGAARYALMKRGVI